MSHIDFPGAKIYHEVIGDGPLLLCIPGGNGGGDIWKMMAMKLKDHFKVVFYDRESNSIHPPIHRSPNKSPGRGFSNSYLTSEQDYAHRLDGEGDDAARLIRKYSPDEPATVIGNSSGAIIALNLLSRYPNLIRTLIPFEPPIARLMPNYEELWAMHKETYETWRNGGPFPAMAHFSKLTKMDMSMMLDLSMPTLWPNMQYWFEREFMTIPDVVFNVEKDFGPVKDKLMPIVGADSPRDAYQCRSMEVVCEKLGLEYLVVPGGHMAHATHAEAFATKVMEHLRAKDEFYAKL